VDSHSEFSLVRIINQDVDLGVVSPFQGFFFLGLAVPLTSPLVHDQNPSICPRPSEWCRILEGSWRGY
jgi:hypothetical protein